MYSTNICQMTSPQIKLFSIMKKHGDSQLGVTFPSPRGGGTSGNVGLEAFLLSPWWRWGLPAFSELGPGSLSVLQCVAQSYTTNNYTSYTPRAIAALLKITGRSCVIVPNQGQDLSLVISHTRHNNVACSCLTTVSHSTTDQSAPACIRKRLQRRGTGYVRVCVCV